MTEANDETACSPLAREGVFTYLDPWRARERDLSAARAQAVEELAARGFSREDAERSLGAVIDLARWDEFRASFDRLFDRLHFAEMPKLGVGPESSGTEIAAAVEQLRARAVGEGEQ